MASALFIWVFIQSFVIGGVISLVSRTRINYILSGIFLAVSLNTMFQYVFRYTDIKYDYPRLLFLTDVLDFLIPSLAFWYVNYLFNRKIKPQYYWYFLPPLASLLTLFIFVFGQADFTFGNYIGTTIHKLTLLALVLWKIFVFYKLLIILKSENLSTTAKQSSLIPWPRAITTFVGITIYIALVQFVHLAILIPYLESYAVVQIRKLVQLNYILFNSSIILFALYFPLKYPKILSGEPIIKSSDPLEFAEGKEYSEKLNKLIEEEQAHLNSELNEKALADQMGIQSYVLSRLLNEYIGKSFSEFINEKRIDAAKQMLKNDQNKKLTNFAVAVDSGFRSESVFYVNFKKITGMTPTQYKKSIGQKLKNNVSAAS